MNNQVFCIGVYRLSGRLLRQQQLKGKRLDLRVMGLLTLDADVTPELIRAAVGTIALSGTVRGPAEAVAALRALTD